MDQSANIHHKSAMTTLIEAHDLHKSFGHTHAVNGLSLSVQAGEAWGRGGPDGAGKTTTLRLLVGALHADSGSAQVGGHDVARQTEQARAGLGYLAQRFSMYGDLTVMENLRFFGQVRGVSGAALERRAEELLKFVGLGGFESRRADQLSGGMKQKLGLACALVHQPKVLLLDEPTGGVDPGTRQGFWQLILPVLGGGGGGGGRGPAPPPPAGVEGVLPVAAPSPRGGGAPGGPPPRPPPPPAAAGATVD